MKYSRSALGLLNAQYRSVLRKCFLINVGVFALGMTAAQADNFKLDAEKLSTSSNIKWVEISADKYDESNKNMIKVDLSKNESQYFQYTYTSDPDKETISERQTGLSGEVSADFKNIDSLVEGGAIYNTNTLKVIGDFVDNSANASWGGAIYNKGNIEVKGNFIGNKTGKTVGTGYGGGFYSTLGGTFSSITGDFINNGITSETACGGAIYVTLNETKGDIIGNFIGNYLRQESDNKDHYSKGGAIDLWRAKIGTVDGYFINNNIKAHHWGQGAAMNMGNSSVDTIKGLFVNNRAVIEAGSFIEHGGAINMYNNEPTEQMYVGKINADFYYNGAEHLTGAAYGGAIDASNATIDYISGNFVGNYVQGSYNNSSVVSARGGAISVRTDTNIKYIKGSFVNNHASNLTASSQTWGGAIENNASTIGIIEADFIGNYAESLNTSVGGGIYNRQSTVGVITGGFVGNYAKSLDISMGGGIYNLRSTIEKIKGNFVGNYAKASEFAAGGAINNNTEGKINEGIEGSFIRNHVEAENSFVRGGAVANWGYIKNIQGDMLENYARTNSSYVTGGALTNMYASASSQGIIDALSGVYANNYAESNGTGSASYAQGGAIYNGANATISNIIDSAFIGNEARGYTDATDGGAIWNAGKITFSGNNIFADNYKTVNGVKTANDIYNQGEINVAENGVLNIGGGISGNGSGKINLNENAALQLNNSVADGNSVTMADGASLAFNVNAFETAENVQNGGRFNGDIQLNGKNNLLVSSYVSGGENSGDGLYKFANDVDATNGEWALSLNNNGLYNMNVSVNDDNNTLLMKYQKKSAQEIADALDMSTEKGFETAALSGPKTDNDIFNNISEIVNNSAQTGNKNLSKMLDDLNDNTQGNAEVARLLNDRISSKIETRLNFRRNERLGVYGLSGGDALQYKPQVWANVIYQSAKNSGDNDFDADTTGFIAGVDGRANENLTLGLGYAYQKTDMKSGAAKTDIATHSILGYGEYSWKNWFANALLSYNKSSYEQKKNAFSSVLKGDFDVDVLGVQLLTGKNIYTAMGNNRTAIRPQAGVRYYKLNQDDYTDNAGMKYESDDSDILVGVVGVEASMNKQINNLTVTPKVFVNALYDLKNDDSNTLVKLPNGNAYTVSQKSNGKFGIEAGAEMNFAVTENLQTGVAYEYDWKDDYSAHTGMITLKYAF